MWTSDKIIHSEKFFSSATNLEARRQAFAYADNLVEIMEEAKQAGVIHYNNAEEILNPKTTIEEVIIGSVHVSVAYEEIKDDITITDEDIIYMPVANEGSIVEVPIDENQVAQITSIETIDLTDDESIRIHNREASYYLKTGGADNIVSLAIEGRQLLLLMDDFIRLKNKNLILVEEEKDTKQKV